MRTAKWWDFPGFAGFQYQTHPGTAAVANQVVVDAGGSQQRRDRRMPGINAAVRQDDIGVARLNGLVDLLVDFIQGLVQPGTAVGDGIQDGNGHGPEARHVHIADAGQLGIGEQRRRNTDALAALGAGLQQVGFRAYGRGDLGDQFLANAVQGRIGDLGEQLLEIIVQQARPVGQHGQGRIRPH